MVEKPDALNWVQAATVGVPFSTAALVLQRAGLKEGSGESVLVLGANGAVGAAVVQLARARGARVLEGVRNDSGDVNTASDPSLSANLPQVMRLQLQVLNIAIKLGWPAFLINLAAFLHALLFFSLPELASPVRAG